jgi:predicted nucleic acid-binding protein
VSGILFDTSVYIQALREGEVAVLGLRHALRTADRQTRPLWLSLVVLEELYVGAAETKVRRDLQRMEREFDKIGRLLLPGRSDWTCAGQVLSRIGQKYGFSLVRKARLTNDALIAMSAASHGFTIKTKNPGDFQMIAEFRSFNWEAV